MATSHPKVRYETVQGFPSYRIGTDASVWSRKTGEWVKLRPGLASNGYLTVCLSGRSQDGKVIRRTFCLHKLMLDGFVGTQKKGTVCRHLDGNKLNNNLDNLIWGTYQENTEDSRLHGTLVLGEKAVNGKLTKSKVLEIRRRYAAGGIYQYQLAKEYKIHQVTVSEIVTRKIWRHI